jgi:hypothetical protein
MLKFIIMYKLRRNSFIQILFLPVILCVFNLHLKAQITIGSLSEPQGGALLDLKELEIADPGAETFNSTKGVLFPKVSLQSATSLAPLFTTATDSQKKTSKGMIVYNVNPDATGLDIGLCVWTGEEWNSVVGRGPSSIAKLKIDCGGTITVSGNYSKGKSLNPYTNAITIPVEVSQKGSYHIVAYSDPYNQYYFETNNEFFREGKFNVILNGVGIPVESTQDRGNVLDKIKIFINDVEQDIVDLCGLAPLELEVEDISANYYFNCSQIDISHIQLQQGVASTDSYIDIRLQVPEEAAGAKYHIETNTVNGIKFEGSGTLSPGQQLVRLQSNGAIPESGEYDFYFISNSADPRISDCSFSVFVLSRAINVAIFSDTGGGTWDLGSPGRGVRSILESSVLFGLNGGNNNPLCPVSAINIDHRNAIPSSYSYSGMDIVIISYSVLPTDDQNINKLVDFINSGGVVIQCVEGMADDRVRLLNAVFGSGVLTRAGGESSSDNTHIILSSGNPLTNGVYDLTAKRIGYDGGYNLGFEISDPNNVAEVIGKRSSDDRATIVRHKTKPYIILGDGGIFAGSTAQGASSYQPLQVSADGLPVVRTAGVYANIPGGAYNAHWFVNMIIWAINYRLSLP